MRCLTNSEIHKWLGGQGMRHQPLDGGAPFAGDFPISSEPGNRSDFAWYLADLLAKDGNKLLEILPSPQLDLGEWDLMSCFRKNAGETRPVIAAPGHLFKCCDRAEFRDFLSKLMGQANDLGFYIYCAPSRTSLLVHSRIQVWCHKKGICNELSRHLAPPQAA